MKSLLSGILFFYIFDSLSAQSVKAINIIPQLNPYLNLLDELHKKESNFLDSINSEKILSWQLITNSRSIKLQLFKNPDTEIVRALLPYLVVEFDINFKHHSRTLKKVYCEDSLRIQTIKNFVEKTISNSEAGVKYPSVVTENILSYLKIADEIAEEGYYCGGTSNGVNIYTQIAIDKNWLKLEQRDYSNSRNIEGAPYHLRDLVFYIPLLPVSESPRFHTNYQIGDMSIEFEDHSSDKRCGQLILGKIKKEKITYKKQQ